MVITKYKLFEQKLETTEELSKLLDMAIATDDLELVKFFVSKGARSTDDTLENASYDEDIFKYLLDNNYKLKLSVSRLNDTGVQKTLIDYNKYNYILENLGYFNKQLKSDKKYKESVDNFFKNPGKSKESLLFYQHAFEWAKDDKELFLYFLEEGGDYKSLKREILKEPEAQKALIDFGKDLFVKDVGFSPELRDDPKYKKWLEMGEEFDKYNM